ncbi:MAG: DUF5799 family protein [Haloarculaceae archaeon]
MTTDWRDSLAGARMQVDRQFESRVVDSGFSSQEWGLIMTAVEFEVANPADPERAEMYAATDQMDQIIPELERIQREMGGSQTAVEEGDGGGLLGSIRQMLGGLASGGNGRSDSERLAEAEVLVQEYADKLQSYLEKQGRWDDVRTAASAEATESE